MTRKGNVVKVKQFRSSGGTSVSSACIDDARYAAGVSRVCEQDPGSLQRHRVDPSGHDRWQQASRDHQPRGGRNPALQGQGPGHLRVGDPRQAARRRRLRQVQRAIGEQHQPHPAQQDRPRRRFVVVRRGDVGPRRHRDRRLLQGGRAPPVSPDLRPPLPVRRVPGRRGPRPTRSLPARRGRRGGAPPRPGRGRCRRRPVEVAERRRRALRAAAATGPCWPSAYSVTDILGFRALPPVSGADAATEESSPGSSGPAPAAAATLPPAGGGGGKADQCGGGSSTTSSHRDLHHHYAASQHQYQQQSYRHHHRSQHNFVSPYYRHYHHYSPSVVNCAAPHQSYHFANCYPAAVGALAPHPSMYIHG